MNEVYNNRKHGNYVNFIKIAALTCCMLLFTNAWAADRYWVGKSGTWNTAANWSLTSGGAGGASVPTAATTVIFDDNSFDANGQIVTLAGTPVCDSMIWKGTVYNPVFAMGTINITISGSLVFQPGMTITSGTGTRLITFSSTRPQESITTNNVTIPRDVTFNSTTCKWTLQTPLTLSGSGLLNFNNGYLDCNAKAIKCVSFTNTAAGTRTLDISNTTIDASGGWNYSGGTTTLMAANSLIRLATNFIGNNGDNYNVVEAGSGTLRGGNFKKIIVNKTTVTFNSAAGQFVNTDTLLFGQGNASCRIAEGSDVNVSTYLAKTHANPMALTSTSTGTGQATINMGASSTTVKMDTLILSKIKITGPGADYPTEGSADGGNNTGWLFNNLWNEPNTYYWRGGLRDGNLLNVDNWEMDYPGSDHGISVIFSAMHNVCFPPNPNNPASMTLNMGSPISLKNLYINIPGTALTIANSAATIIAGDIILTRGSLTLNNDTFGVNVAGDIIANGGMSFPTVTAKNIKVLSGTMALRRDATVTDSIIVNVGATITKSNVNNSSINCNANTYSEVIINGRLVFEGSAGYNRVGLHATKFTLGRGATLTNVYNTRIYVTNDCMIDTLATFTIAHGLLDVGGNLTIKGTLSSTTRYIYGTTQYVSGATGYYDFIVRGDLHIMNGGRLNLDFRTMTTGNGPKELVYIYGNTLIDPTGSMIHRGDYTSNYGPEFRAYGNFRVEGTLLFDNVAKFVATFYDSLTVTGHADFINCRIVLQSSKSNYALRLGTPTTTTITGGYIQFNAPATVFNLTEDLIAPTTDIYITATNRSLYSNGHKIVCRTCTIANGATAGRMLDFSNSLIDVSSVFALDGTRTNEHNFKTTTISFRGANNHALNVNLAGDTIRKVTFTEIGSRMTLTTGANGVRIDTLITGDRSINLNFTSPAALTANVWQIAKPCNIYAMNSPIVRVGTITGPPVPLPCEGISQLHSINGKINLNKITTTGSIPLRNIYFSNVTFGGTGVPNAFESPENYDLDGNSGAINWTTPPDPDPVGTDFYWIGEEGSWFDPTKWSFDQFPPKTPANCLPTLFDNVFFDEYSFTDDSQRITIDSMPASIHNISWIDPAKSGGIVVNLDLSILGSVDFTGCTYAASANDTRVIFLSRDNETITSGGLVYGFNIVCFSHKGTYRLMDDFILKQTPVLASGLYHYSGALVSNGHNITTSRFNSTGSARSIDFSGSTIKTLLNNVAGSYYIGSSGNGPATWTLNLNNLTSHNFVGSTIDTWTLTTTGSSGQSVAYYDAKIQYQIAQTAGLKVSYNDITAYANGDGATYTNRSVFQYGFTANNLFLEAYNREYIFNYSATTPNTYIIRNTLTTNATPLICNSDTIRTTIKGNVAATPSKISVGDTTSSFQITRAVVANINCVGDTMRVNDGINGGNNTKVVIIPRIPVSGKDFYWVPNTHVEPGNTGSGFWHDASHWSVGVSGGNPAVNNADGCYPSSYDNVFFDGNSFTANGQAVRLEQTESACKNMTWTPEAGAKAPDFAGSGANKNLSVHGSLILAGGMVRFSVHHLYMRGQGIDSIRFNGFDVSIAGRLSNLIYFTNNGRYDIMDSKSGIIATDNVNIMNGQVYMHGNLTFPTLIIQNGSLYTNGYNITATDDIQIASASVPRTLDFSGSTIRATYLNGWNLTNTTMDISNTTITSTSNTTNTITFAASTVWNAANSIITSSGSFAINNATTQDFAFHNLRMTGATQALATIGGTGSGNLTFNKIQFTGKYSLFNNTATYTIDTLIYSSSSVNRIMDGKVLNINKKLISGGSPCGITEIKSTNETATATKATINMVHCDPILISYVKITNIIAGTTCPASNHVAYEVSTNHGSGAVNWTIKEIEGGGSTAFLGPNKVLTCADLPFIQTSDLYGIGESYKWWYKAPTSPKWVVLPETGSTLNITATGNYALRVDYGTSCFLGDTIAASFSRYLTLFTVAPTAVITTNSATNIISCISPSITLTANEIEDPLDTLSYSWKDALGNSLGTTQSIVVTDSGTYTVKVTCPSNSCLDSAKITIGVYDPDDLLDCATMPNKTVLESSYGLGYYQHSGTDWDATAASCVTLVDSTYYIEIAGTLYTGHTLNGFNFPIGTTTVTWVAEALNSSSVSIFDTCSYTVTVLMTDLINCTHTGNVVLDEDAYGVGYHTHSGTVPYIMPLSGIVLDSVTYIVADTLIISGPTASLNGVRFYRGAPTPVVVIAHLGTNTDTCTLTITVRRVCPPSLSYNGHTYNVIDLSSLCWTTNLKATHYANGDPIAWAKPYYSPEYPNTAANAATFGLLYTWYSAVGVPEGDDTATPTPNLLGFVQGICPDDWHIPSDAEWNLLNAYPAADLKSTTLWINGVGTNLTGFNAVPAGMCSAATNKFINLYGETNWWSSDGDITTTNYFYLAYYCDIIKEIITKKGDGLSVRCVMD